MNYCNKCGTKVNKKDIICQNCGNVYFQNDVYNTKVLEKIRIKALCKCIVSYLILFTIIAYSSYIGNAYKINITQIIICSIAYSFPIIIFITKAFTKKYKKTYKYFVVSKSLKELFDDIIYEPEKGINPEILKNTKMIQTGNKISSNDYIEGNYKNVLFKEADVTITYKDNDNNETLFKGQWMVFEFNKPFISDVQVCEKNFKNSQVSGGIFKRVYLENEKFNNIFSVYAKDSVEAFYILTPHNMEKIMELNDKIYGSLLLCFIDNKLHIGLYNNKDFFEPSLLRKVNLVSASKKTIEQFQTITAFIDILDLDNNLFRKGV